MAEAKELKLVCKCGSCTHWEIVINTGNETTYEKQRIICVKCGLEVEVQFAVGPHEGLHYEKHVKGDEKNADTCTTVAVA